MASQWDHGDFNNSEKELPLSKSSGDKRNKQIDDANRIKDPPLQYLRRVRVYGLPRESENAQNVYIRARVLKARLCQKVYRRAHSPKG